MLPAEFCVVEPPVIKRIWMHKAWIVICGDVIDASRWCQLLGQSNVSTTILAISKFYTINSLFSTYSTNMAAAIQHFVGDKPVDSFPPEAISQIPDEVLRKREAERLSKGEHKEPGAGRRAGAATRNPDGTRIWNCLLRGLRGAKCESFLRLWYQRWGKTRQQGANGRYDPCLDKCKIQNINLSDSLDPVIWILHRPLASVGVNL